MKNLGFIFTILFALLLTGCEKFEAKPKGEAILQHDTVKVTVHDTVTITKTDTVRLPKVEPVTDLTLVQDMIDGSWNGYQISISGGIAYKQYRVKVTVALNRITILNVETNSTTFYDYNLEQDQSTQLYQLIMTSTYHLNVMTCTSTSLHLTDNNMSNHTWDLLLTK